MKSQTGLSKALAALLVLGLAFSTGCHKTEDPEAYQEYSELEKSNGETFGESTSPDGNGVMEIIAPAVAQKISQPAVAEAGGQRAVASETQQVSTDATQPKAKSRPGEIVLAETKAKPREIKLLVPEKRFTKADTAGTLRVSYDDIDLLKILNADPVPLDIADHFPEWLEELDGQRIRIRGFMYPEFQETGLRGFILARDNAICCFGRDPKIYDLIRVVMKEGTTTNYLPNRPFDVEGTFHIVPEAGGKTLFRLYEIRDAAVITDRS